MNKLEKLKEFFREKGRIAVAYSGGVDSTFLIKVAHDVLGDNCLAITAISPSFPHRERDEAAEFLEKEGIKHITFHSNELSLEGYVSNPVDRCYHCKKYLFSNMVQLAKDYGFPTLVEGSNMDDIGDYRPGMRAIRELNVLSPLQICDLSKAEIREYSKELQLPTWDKSSFACLATRFVYGNRITKEGLERVEKAENVLKDLGLTQYRVRVHGNLARIEVKPEDFIVILNNNEMIDTKFKEFGFDYVSLDLKGYRTGSMNEVLRKEKK